VEGVTHGDGGSTMQCGSGVALRSAAALDATGHALKLVEFDTKFDPGYQVCRQGRPVGHTCTGLQRRVWGVAKLQSPCKLLAASQ
jgi:hypothetical protein